MINQYKTNKMSYITFGAMIFGMVVGCIVYLTDMAYWNTGLTNQGLEAYSIGVVLNLPMNQIMMYIVKRRIGQILFFVLGAVITSYAVMAGVYSLLFGVFYGMIICNVLLQYGVIGIGYGAACFCPHYVCYLIAIYLCGRWFSSQGEAPKRYMENVNLLQYLIKFFVIFFLVFFSLVWEIKFQKNFLNFFYQYLV